VRDSKNRLQAADIRFPGQAKPDHKHAAPKYAAALIVPFGCIVIALAAFGKTPFLVPFVYLIASTITFLAYGFDKSAAMNDRRRTPESTLHLLSLVGGWPGALVAQQMFHHKSRSWVPDYFLANRCPKLRALDGPLRMALLYSRNSWDTLNRSNNALRANAKWTSASIKT
jgi:uncharacterized membrane protein YsdA (DUF1294 family)